MPFMVRIKDLLKNAAQSSSTMTHTVYSSYMYLGKSYLHYIVFLNLQLVILLKVYALSTDIRLNNFISSVA